MITETLIKPTELVQNLTHMKAFVYENYGSPHELKLKEVARPVPKDNEILVRVGALSLNPAEWHLLRGSVWMIRLAAGLTKPKRQILGADISGHVEAVGKNVTSFKVGDAVFGRNFTGALAEYACLEQTKAALVPENMSLKTAAAIPLASVTALIALRDKGNIQQGHKVLINGASGGIGTFAVQLANYLGAEVTGVCSTQNIDLVRSLGANNVIDYTREDFTKDRQCYDLIIDLIGNRSASQMNRILKPGGRCVQVGFSGAGKLIRFILKGTWLSKTGSKKFVLMNAETKKIDLELIAGLVAEGKIRPIIDGTYSFEDIPKAFKYLGSRRAKGKIVIEVARDIKL